MKFIVALLLTALLGFAGALYFDWWIIAIAAFIVAACIPQNALASFLSGFFALFILWAGQAAYIDAQNNHLLSTKVASLLPLGGSYIAIILVTAFIGGLVAGMSALTAAFLQRPVKRRTEIE